MLYGNYIGVSYHLETKLDSEALMKAWKILNRQFPALCTRFDRASHKLVAKPSVEPIVLRSENADVRDLISSPHLDFVRDDFLSEPEHKAAENGRAPMATLTVTDLTQHGTVLGLAIAHVVTDAGGFHRIARQLADNYNAIINNTDIPDAGFLRRLPEFRFGTSRDWAQTQEELSRLGLNKPVSLQGVFGRIMRRLIASGMKHITSIKRVPVHFSNEQVARLKDTVLRESGEDWISTNVALCAHFSSIMMDLIYDGRPGKPKQFGQLLDLRNRYFDDPENFQNRFIGNAIMIHSEMADLNDYSRGNLARFFKSMTTDLSPEFITSRMNIISDCFRHGRSYPGLDMKTPMICVNNQTKMPVYDLDFGGVKPSRVLPQDVGDNIMFFPAADGGVETYLRVFQSKRLHNQLSKPEWQARIFDF